MDKVLLVPFSPAAMDYALKVEDFFEQTQQNTSPMYIASVAISLFRNFVLMNYDNRSIVGYSSAGVHHISFEDIRRNISAKPTDHWTLANLPEEFFETCHEITRLAKLGSHEDVVLVSIGYLATLVGYIESGIGLFVCTFAENEIIKADQIEFKIFESYRPRFLQ